MQALLDLRARIQNIDMSNIINKAVEFNKDEIIKMNTEDQIYNNSTDSSGGKLKPITNQSPYVKPYITKKKKAGVYRGQIDLSFTGKYLKGWIIEYGNGYFELKSKNVKVGSHNLNEILKKNYGEDIEGLTDKNKERVSRLLIPYILQEMKKFLSV